MEELELDSPPWVTEDGFPVCPVPYVSSPFRKEIDQLIRYQTDIRNLVVRKILSPVLRSRDKGLLWEDLVVAAESFLGIVSEIRSFKSFVTLALIRQYLEGFHLERYTTKSVRLVLKNLREWSQMVRPFVGWDEGECDAEI